MPKTELLFSRYDLGGIELSNRMVMAPMTRSRSIGNVPGEIVAEYYGQRTDAGLIVTEGTAPSPNGLGYPRIPGLFDSAQAAGWKQVTEAVHARGGKMFVQLMHTGRVAHIANLPKGAKIVAPSPVRANGEMWVDPDGPQPISEPNEMTSADIETAIEEFAHSAELAIGAGFDGVELHGANGYLIDQFLNTASNKRTDEWGGSVENRIRFAVSVAERVADRIGPKKVGIRISPYGVFNEMQPDPEHDELFVALAKRLSEIGLVYVHIVDHSSMGAPEVPAGVKAKIREAFGGTIILSGGYDPARAEADLEEGKGELVAFGRPFLANPDLVTRFREGRALNEPNPDTFYSPGPEGYTDYPTS